MMQVVRVKKIEDCFDGSFIKEFEMDEKITLPFIKKLGQGCCLEYFSDFPRPFFRIEKKNEFQIKGVENSTTMRVIFNRSCSLKCVENLIHLIQTI